MTADELTNHLERVRDGLQVAENTKHAHPLRSRRARPDQWCYTERRKYIAIDIVSVGWRAGAFLVDKSTGELYNIKGYGVPDHNKKRKANIGNIASVDPAWLHAHRWNYLR